MAARKGDAPVRVSVPSAAAQLPKMDRVEIVYIDFTHYSRSTQFVVCSTFVFIFYVAYGYLQVIGLLTFFFNCGFLFLGAVIPTARFQAIRFVSHFGSIWHLFRFGCSRKKSARRSGTAVSRFLII